MTADEERVLRRQLFCLRMLVCSFGMVPCWRCDATGMNHGDSERSCDTCGGAGWLKREPTDDQS